MQFDNHLRKFREHKKSVEKEAELSHMIESAESRALERANRLQLEKEKRGSNARSALSDHKTLTFEKKATGTGCCHSCLMSRMMTYTGYNDNLVIRLQVCGRCSLENIKIGKHQAARQVCAAMAYVSTSL